MEFTEHPVASIFPLMGEAEYEGLVEDIKEHGLKEPIVLHKGEILDGRNRYRACVDLGIEPRFTEWVGNGQTPAEYVVSKNLHRRHLNESQRAMIAARLARAVVGKPANLQDKPLTVPEAAEMVNVGERNVRNARKVLREGTQEQIAAIESGEAAVFTTANELSSKKGGNRIHLRDGQTAEDWCREGLQYEQENDVSADVAAHALGLNPSVYRRARKVVQIAEMDLPEKDKAVALQALEEMNATSQVAAPHDKIAHIADRVWGASRRPQTDKTVAKRLAEFEAAFGHLVFACTHADQIDVPNLPADHAKRCIADLKQSVTHINTLKRKIEDLT